MVLWLRFWFCIHSLRPAFSREQSFWIFLLALVGMCIRTEYAGVTSLVRARTALPDFLARTPNAHPLKKFLLSIRCGNGGNAEKLAA
jgi:hypothetical protein